MTVEKTLQKNSTWANKISGLGVLGRILTEDNLVTQEDVNVALKYAEENGVRLGDALQEMGKVSELDILHSFGKRLDMMVLPRLDAKTLDAIKFDSGFCNKFSSEMLENIGVLPVRFEIMTSQDFGQEWVFHVVVNNPWQHNDIIWLMDSFLKRSKADKQLTGLKSISNVDQGFYTIRLEGYLAKKSEITAILSEVAGRTVAVATAIDEDEEQIAAQQFRDIMNKAISMKASDVHISPLHQRGGLHVRVRKDGELTDLIRDGRVTELEYNTFLNKVMNMSKMDMTRKREPQDGAMQFHHERTLYDMRIAVIPTSYLTEVLDGCHIGIRILYKNSDMSLENLGLLEDDITTVRRLYSRPSGILLLAGPTSSGKTTTIYSILKRLDLDRQCCYTVEDPVEYHLDGAYQIPVSEREGRGFKQILRSLMRLDPDIVFMGEMRDPESALMATQIANTGHAVFSTIHTNSSYTAPQRLLAMGIPNYLVLGNLNGVIAQRLVLKNCPNCTTTYTPSERTLDLLRLPKDGVYRKGTGEVVTERGKMVCPVCSGKGTVGRCGIFEIMPLCFYEGWEDLLSKPHDLRTFFVNRGHRDLMMDAKVKLEKGLISPDSLYGVLSSAEEMISGVRPA